MSKRYSLRARSAWGVLPWWMYLFVLLVAPALVAAELKVIDLRPTGVSNTWRLRWSSVPGADYQVQRAQSDQFNPSGTNGWVPILTVRATNTITTAEDSGGSGLRQRFYRVVQIARELSLRILDLKLVGSTNVWRLRWNSIPGADYQVQRAKDDQLQSVLTNGWVPVLSVRASGEVTSADDAAGSGVRQRFYRVVQLTNEQSLVVSPIDSGGSGGGGGSGTTIRIITGGTQTVSSVVFLDQGNLLNEAVPGIDGSWSLNLPGDISEPRIRQITARVTTVEGTVIDTPAVSFLEADTSKFVPVSEAGSPVYGGFVNVEPDGTLGRFLFYPEGLGDAARTTGAHFEFPPGSTLKTLVGSVGLEFSAARFFRGHIDPAPVEATGGLRTLDFAGVGVEDISNVLGLGGTGSLALLWNGLPLEWRDGALSEKGWSSLFVRPPFGDVLLPDTQECALVSFDTKTGDPTLVVCYHGDWAPFENGPRFRIPRGEPLKIYLSWSGHIAAHGTVEATFPDGATLRGSVAWREPNFEVRFQGRNIVIPALASLKRALPSDPELCLPAGNSTAELDAAAQCLTSIRDTYRALAMGGVAEVTFGGGETYSPLPQPTDSLGPALEAWAARLSSWSADRAGQVLDTEMLGDLRKVILNAAQTGEAAGDLPSVLKLLRGVLMLRQHAPGPASALVADLDSAQERLFLAGERVAAERASLDAPDTFGRTVELLEASLNGITPISPAGSIVAAGGSAQARLRALMATIRDKRGVTFLHRRLVFASDFTGADNAELKRLDPEELLNFLEECVDFLNLLRKEGLANTVFDLPGGAPPLREAMVQVRPHFDEKHSQLAQEAMRANEYGKLRAVLLQRARYFDLNARLGDPLRSDRVEFQPDTQTLLPAFVDRFKARPRTTVASFFSGDMLAVETILDQTLDNGSGSDISWARSQLQLAIETLGFSAGGSDDCDSVSRELLLRGFALSQASAGSEGQRRIRVTGKYEVPTTKDRGPFSTLQVNLGGRYLLGRFQVHAPGAVPHRFLIQGMLSRETATSAEFAFLRRDELPGGATDGTIRAAGTMVARVVNEEVVLDVTESAQFGSQTVSSTTRFVKKIDLASVSPRITTLFTGEAREVIRAQEEAPLHTRQVELLRRRVLGQPATAGGPRGSTTEDVIRAYFDAEQSLVARRVAAANINNHLLGVLSIVSTEQVPLARQLLREMLSRSRITAEGMTLNSWNWLRVIFSRHRSDPQATVGSFRNFMGPEIDQNFAGNSFRYDIEIVDAGGSPGVSAGIFDLGLTAVTITMAKSRTDGVGGTNLIRLEGGYGQMGVGWSPEALERLGEAGGGTGGDSVTAFSNVDYSEQSLEGPLMILGGSAGIGVGFTSASAGPSAMFFYGNRSLPPLGFPLPTTSTGDKEFRVPSIEATFGAGYVVASSAVVDADQFSLSTDPIEQAFSQQAGAQGSVHFDVNVATLRPCGWVGLRELVAEYRSIFESEGSTISILGFTDATGSDALNDDLSQRRADSVKAALTAIVGPGLALPSNRLRAIGLGRKPALGQTPTRDAQLNQSERDFINLKRQELGTLSPGQADQRWRSVSVMLNNLITVDLKTPATP